jgi:hypothetical protein
MARLIGRRPSGPLVHGRRPYPAPGCQRRGAHARLVGVSVVNTVPRLPGRLGVEPAFRGRLGPPDLYCDVMGREGATCPGPGCCRAVGASSAGGLVVAARLPDWAGPSARGWLIP